MFYSSLHDLIVVQQINNKSHEWSLGRTCQNDNNDNDEEMSTHVRVESRAWLSCCWCPASCWASLPSPSSSSCAPYTPATHTQSADQLTNWPTDQLTTWPTSFCRSGCCDGDYHSHRTTSC